MSSNISRAERAALIQQRLAELYPISATLLQFANPWELLVATILAAQCTDARVNTITPELFRRWPGPAELARADQEELEQVIRPTGFFHNKAKNLLGCARALMENFQGELPRSIRELTQLPGVARKTANCVLFGGFGINEGIAVDTHVRRIAYRLALSESQDPLQIERDLMPLFPQSEWGNLNMRLVAFGRAVCKARKPACPDCSLADLCPKREPDPKKDA